MMLKQEKCQKNSPAEVFSPMCTFREVNKSVQNSESKHVQELLRGVSRVRSEPDIPSVPLRSKNMDAMNFVVYDFFGV